LIEIGFRENGSAGDSPAERAGKQNFPMRAIASRKKRLPTYPHPAAGIVFHNSQTDGAEGRGEAFGKTVLSINRSESEIGFRELML
jgi:hypothetical protein